MPRTLLPFLAGAVLLTASSSAQVAPYQLAPGEVVFSDTATGSVAPAVRVLGQDGQVRTLLEGAPLGYPSGVLVDRDGAVLVVDYHGDGLPQNAVLRLPPAGGPPERLNLDPLFDGFMLCRGPKGELLIADGYRGIRELRADGSLAPYGPTAQGVAIGLDLHPDGRVLLSEAAPAFGGGRSGALYAVDPQGQAAPLYVNPTEARAPQDLALGPDGSVFFTQFDQYRPGAEQPRLLRLRANGTAEVLIDGIPLQKPKGVAAGDFGAVVVADTDAQALIRWDRQSGAQHLVGDLDDGIDDGKPLNRPFGVALVPSLWLTVPEAPEAGAPLELRLAAPPRLGGHLVAILASTQRSPFALAQIWPGSPRTLTIDPNQAEVVLVQLASGGAERRVVRTLPSSMRGLALHLQAIEASEQLPSAAVVWRVN